MKQYDVIVVGGGHAGSEAAWSAAGLGAKTTLITLSFSGIAQMSCNPAIGGVGKGQIVREIDALGGVMGLAADATGVQFRILNSSKGPAVRGPRCQSDRHAYAEYVQNALNHQANLEIIEAEATEVLTRDGRACGVRIRQGNETTDLAADAVILTTGTFMKGVMHCGEETWAGGRIGEPSADSISNNLTQLGITLGRLKTGTCPRMDTNTIDYTKCERQDGDNPPKPFSFMNDSLDVDQIPCWITETNQDIHDVVRANFHRGPMYTGQIQSTGPRYCPSFETKLERFPDKTSHQVFIEPEGRNTNWVYCNGISTSMPKDVQKFMVNNIRGMENAIILQYGYAIEYDFAQPTQLLSTLETKALPGLYLAGQINGTTGYEEAAALGMMAAINAVRKLRGDDPLLLRRDQAYIGVMIDDLITKGVTEPYRMFTSRAEHRLLLRADNADRRLTEVGREIGLVDDARWNSYTAKQVVLDEAREIMQSTRLDGKLIWELLRRPNMTLDQLLLPQRGRPGALSEGVGAKLTQLRSLQEQHPTTLATLCVDAIYAGYLEKQSPAVEQMKDLDSKTIPAGLDYSVITHLRHEAREKLAAIRPANLGQALRVSGITPADITVLAVYLTARTKGE